MKTVEAKLIYLPTALKQRLEKEAYHRSRLKYTTQSALVVEALTAFFDKTSAS